jgi:hypothetical protein
VLVDETATAPATDAELNGWLDRHPGSFRGEPKLAFRQVYLRSDRHGAAARTGADKLLARLRTAGPDVAIERLGDASMLPAEQPLEPARDVVRTFGEDFAREVLAVDPGQWAGPIESPFGLHLVLVRERVAGAKPTPEEVRPLIEREVQADRRHAQVQALYDRLLAKYAVTVEMPGAAPAADARAAR